MIRKSSCSSSCSFCIRGYMAKLRSDHTGAHRMAYLHNRKRIMMSESVCGICGRPVDMGLKAPDPMSPTVDHIIPINKGGHPSDLNNLQLAHWICNRMKSDKMPEAVKPEERQKKSIRVSCDWKQF